MVKIVSLVKPTRAKIVYATGAFDNAKEALEVDNYKVASAGEIAGARSLQGKTSEVSRNGGWVKEGFIYVPQKGVFLTKNSPIMANAKEATDCNRNGKWFYLTQRQLEQSLKDSIAITEEPIPTNRFGENNVTAYLFGKAAQRYGEFLQDAKIKQMPVYLASLQEKPFATQLWFGGLDDDSMLDGYYWSLYYDSRVFGVNTGADEGSASVARNSGDSYNSAKIRETLKRMQLSGLEKQFLEELKR